MFERTLVIVTADHGEGMGEHRLFDHGESLYRTEIRVPLLIVLPGQNPPQGVVSKTVSLRDLPATIVDLIGLGTGSPFPGRSLASLWRDPSPGSSAFPGEGEAAISELVAPNPTRPNQDRSPANRGPLISLAGGEFVYIRNEGDRGEELFNQRDDPGERRNLVGESAMQAILEQFRRRLDEFKARPSH